MDEGLDGGLVDVTDVGCRLTRLKTLEDHSGVDEPERVNHDLALHRLDGIHNDGNGAAVQLLE